VAGGWVYAGLDDGTVVAVSVATGHLVWRTKLAFGAIGPLAAAGDLLLAPSIGPGGGILAFRHDPSGTLLDVHSPTELDLPVALADFAGAFVLMLAVVLGLFGALGRRTERALDVAPATGPSTDASADEDDQDGGP
jgi:hypothetical protein